MRALQWLSAWLSAAPMLVPLDRDLEGSRLRRAASRHHAHRQSHNQIKALDLIDKQEGGLPPMDAIEAMLRGEIRD